MHDLFGENDLPLLPLRLPVVQASTLPSALITCRLVPRSIHQIGAAKPRLLMLLPLNRLRLNLRFFSWPIRANTAALPVRTTSFNDCRRNPFTRGASLLASSWITLPAARVALRSTFFLTFRSCARNCSSVVSSPSSLMRTCVGPAIATFPLQRASRSN